MHKKIHDVFLLCSMVAFLGCNPKNDPAAPKPDSNDQNPNTDVSLIPEDAPENVKESLTTMLGLCPELEGISDVKVAEDGSFTCTDKAGNAISCDATGNITIVGQEGDTTRIDHTIHEDTTATDPKVGTAWQGNEPMYENLSMINDDREILNRVYHFGFQMPEGVYCRNDTTDEKYHRIWRKLTFGHSTCALTKVDTLKNYHSVVQWKYQSYELSDQVVQQSEYESLEMVVKGYSVDINQIYMMEVDTIRQLLFHFSTRVPSLLLLYAGTESIEGKTTTVEVSKKTEYYNYRRFSGTQLVLGNASGQMRVDEGTHDGFPVVRLYEWNNSESIAELDYVMF